MSDQRPTPLSVSLAEEIADDILKSFGATPEELPDLKKDEPYRQITQIIQRHVEPLERALKLLTNGSNPLGGLPYQSWVRHTAREALARIKEGR